MLGSPIAHSRSPAAAPGRLSGAGSDDWTYERIECTADELPALVGGFGPEWVGVSVTMPGKFAALRFADERTTRAELVGSANTLVRTPTGWRADNTDIDGVTGALGAASGHAIVVGSGGTAPAVVVGLAELGVQRITVVARNRDKATPVVDLASKVGCRRAAGATSPDPNVAQVVAAADAVVSTIPADAAARYASVLAATPVLLDAIYDPWPTPLAVGGRSGRRPSDQRPADAAAPGLRTGGAIHRAARAERGDESGAAERLASVHGGGGGRRVRAGVAGGAEPVRHPGAAAAELG